MESSGDDWYEDLEKRLSGAMSSSSSERTLALEDSAEKVLMSGHLNTENHFKPSHVRKQSLRRFSLQPGLDANTLERHASKPMGAEPGVNFDTMIVDIEHAVGSEIMVVDYTQERSHEQSETIRANSKSSSQVVQELLRYNNSWSSVRWVAVTGLCMEAIEPIVQKYKLHPLAVENMLDIPQRTKLMALPGQIFCCFPLHLLCTSPYTPSLGLWIKSLFKPSALMYWRACRETGKDSDCESESNHFGQRFVSSLRSRANCTPRSRDDSLPASVHDKIQNLKPRTLSQWDDKSAGSYETIGTGSDQLQCDHSKYVAVEQVSMFVCGNTVITFFEKSGAKIIHPVLERIRSKESSLRETSNPALLVQAIIDACVDHLDPIVTEYSGRMVKLQQDAIKWPTLGHSRALHTLNMELTMLLNSVELLLPMVCAHKARLKLYGQKARRPESSSSNNEASSCKKMGESCTCLNCANELMGLYFDDVYDHALSYSKRLSIMTAQAKSITSLIFNTISIQSGNSVRSLSLVTVVFLPLSFLTGYFGMNFEDFDSLHNNTDYYWAIAGPCCAVLMLCLVYGWMLEKIMHLKTWLKAW